MVTLSSGARYIVTFFKISAVFTQEEDCSLIKNSILEINRREAERYTHMKRICPIGIKRSWRTAVDTVLQQLQTRSIGADHLISVCHAGVPEWAQQVLQQVKERFATAKHLTPVTLELGGKSPCIVDKKTWMDLPMRYQPYNKLGNWLIHIFLR